MEAAEITELEDLKKRLLKKDGKPRKDAEPVLVERMNQLQEQFDKEHTAEFPDNAEIKAGTQEHILNVCGKRTRVTGPSIPRQ